MTVRGGMTEYYEKTDRRLEFAEELRRAHPDIVRVTEKWGRWHHHVDYSRFTQQLKRRSDVKIPRGVNEFGMRLQERGKDGVFRDVVEENPSDDLSVSRYAT
jgi:hypothetical protein